MCSFTVKDSTQHTLTFLGEWLRGGKGRRKEGGGGGAGGWCADIWFDKDFRPFANGGNWRGGERRLAIVQSYMKVNTYHREHCLHSRIYGKIVMPHFRAFIRIYIFYMYTSAFTAYMIRSLETHVIKRARENAANRGG